MKPLKITLPKYSEVCAQLSGQLLALEGRDFAVGAGVGLVAQQIEGGGFVDVAHDRLVPLRLDTVEHNINLKLHI